MVTERQKVIALERIRQLQSNTGRHNRIHDGARFDNANRIRAINGVCGQCQMLNIELAHKDGKNIAILRCEAGLSPLNLYARTDIFSEAICPEDTSQSAKLHEKA